MANKYKRFSQTLDELEVRVKLALEMEINQSKHISKHVNEKCLKVDISGYTELAIINKELTFLDSDGLHYSLDCDCDLTDLIDILNSL